MFIAEQYRATAAEFNALLANTPRSPNETSEFRKLAQTYTTLAENEEWMAVHLDRTVQRRKHGDDSAALAEVEEQILQSFARAGGPGWATAAEIPSYNCAHAGTRPEFTREFASPQGKSPTSVGRCLLFAPA